MPDTVVTVATPGDVDIQVPPVTASLNVVVSPVHTFLTPVIAVGCRITVIVVVVKQPPVVV